MDRQGGLTVKQAAAQLGVAEKTLYRRLRKPGHSGLDAWKVSTPKGEEWRVNLTTPLDVSQDSGQDSGGGAVSPVPQRMARPSVSPVGDPDLSRQVVDTMREVIIAQQRRLEAAAEERGRLRAVIESYEQRQANAEKPLQRPWWAFWRGRGA